jgi:hypothetical protein
MLDQTMQVPAPATAQAKCLLLQQSGTFINGEVNVDPAQRTLQRPRVFYRREVEPQPLVVAKR